LAEGDWLALVRGLASPRIGNIALMLVGAAGYGLSVLLSARALPSFVLIDGVRGGRRRLWRLLIIAYLADGITACGAGLFDPQGAGWAIANNSAPASWLAGAGFLALPWLQTGRAIQSTPSAARVERSWRWLLVGALGTGFFVFVLGAGIHC
jgi:hypothetical protein